MGSTCEVCGSQDEEEEQEEEEEVSAEEVIVVNGSTSCICSDRTILGSTPVKKGLFPNCNGSDCGYSSSMEGSETGSRVGSDVCCTEGICNHDEADYTTGHHCAEDKEEEEDGVDSCVECWVNSEENTKCKIKKKKRKGKGLCNDQRLTAEVCEKDGNTREHSPTTSHPCRNKEA